MPLSISLLIATGLHALALFFVFNNLVHFQFDANTQSPLSVALDKQLLQKPKASKPLPEPVKALPVEPKRLSKKVVTTQPVTKPAIHKVPAVKHDPVKPKQQPAVVEVPIAVGINNVAPANQLAELKDQYLKDLLRAIAQQQLYPASAQRRGQEGRVLASFAVRADGAFIDVNIAKSSGYRILDKAALQAVKQASGFAPLPKALLNEPWVIQAPIAFKLIDD